jgi:predicted anti-sigma-YlaC factor YlaD
MNCQLCRKELDAYSEGRLPDDMKTQVAEHLQHCADCAESYNLQSLAQMIINEEKVVSPDTYLTTRIMAQIENPEETVHKTISPFTSVLRPALIITSMAASILFGVMIGNIYKPSARVLPRPVELALIDDVAIEAVNVLSNE